ncbi:winged helix-turn-helix domain-containing protein [Salmonella enterica]
MNKCYCAINNWLIDQSSGSILHLITGERKRLGVYQLRLLEVLQQNAGKIFTREELTNLVWERRVIGNNSLPNAIHTLRAALEDDGKQQRIIRTIPKRGYVLEPEFCQIIEKDNKEVHSSEEELTQAGKTTSSQDSVDGLQAVQEQRAFQLNRADSVPSTLPALPQYEKRFFASAIGFCWKMPLIILLFVVATIASSFAFVKQNPLPEPYEVAEKVYSNVRIYVVPMPSSNLQGQLTTYNRLKDTFSVLNQELKSKSVNMSVYYRNANQTLNYTLRLHNSCDQEVLAMQIYNWRSNTTLLNNLILSESRRKLNEIASC